MIPILSDAGLDDGVIKTCNKVLAVDPTNVDVMHSKCSALCKHNGYFNALKLYDKILEIDPENIEAIINKGQAFTWLNRHDEALKCYDCVINIIRDVADNNHVVVDALKGKGLSFSNSVNIINPTSARIRYLKSIHTTLIF